MENKGRRKEMLVKAKKHISEFCVSCKYYEPKTQFCHRFGEKVAANIKECDGWRRPVNKREYNGPQFGEWY